MFRSGICSGKGFVPVRDSSEYDSLWALTGSSSQEVFKVVTLSFTSVVSVIKSEQSFVRMSRAGLEWLNRGYIDRDDEAEEGSIYRFSAS